MGQVPIIESFKSTSGHSNVDSTTCCVETAARVETALVEVQACLRWWLYAFLIVGSLAATAGCVETAECNDAVSCPDAQVCYASRCREVCQTQAECSTGETCTPCINDGAESDEGECFGETLHACVPEE